MVVYNQEGQDQDSHCKRTRELVPYGIGREGMGVTTGVNKSVFCSRVLGSRVCLSFVFATAFAAAWASKSHCIQKEDIFSSILLIPSHPHHLDLRQVTTASCLCSDILCRRLSPLCTPTLFSSLYLEEGDEREQNPIYFQDVVPHLLFSLPPPSQGYLWKWYDCPELF